MKTSPKNFCCKIDENGNNDNHGSETKINCIILKNHIENNLNEINTKSDEILPKKLLL